MYWQTGKPPQHGYYLATIQRPDGHRLVSELWFNPNAKVPQGGYWWASRGYIDHACRTGAIDRSIAGVIAWMPKPAPSTCAAPRTEVRWLETTPIDDPDREAYEGEL
jgi:hypothetical protein